MNRVILIGRLTDPTKMKYDVGLEKDNRLQQEEVTADRAEEALRKE